MMLLGLDFDNTLVRYDNLFHALAIEKGLIKPSVPADKIAIRDYLRRQGLDEQFTLLQGEVYGHRILEAEPAEGMMEALENLHRRNINMVLVSHKSKVPYKGPAYDLHKAAWCWLEKYGFFASEGLNWSKEQVFFENTKQTKIERIKELNCTHYIDDLPEILALIGSSINRILYTQDKTNTEGSGFVKMHSWDDLIEILAIGMR